jgi:hypothetical protein
VLADPTSAVFSIPYIRTVNLKSDWPTVREALERLGRELALAREEKCALLKVIHGYGSSGAGGEIRIAVQKRLRELVEAGELGGCIFGEDWSRTDEETWRILLARAEVKNDPDLGRGNRGITVVIF